MSHSSIPTDTLYVVRAHPNKDRIKLQCIGMNCIDSTLKDSYDHWDALPDFIKGKVSVLMMVEYDREVKGVGIKRRNRVGVESYYVYDELTKGTWANAWIRR
tara:strand:- start:1 stop:306 length:306 start_codon:yes stop_codon:yes gene_type:complete